MIDETNTKLLKTILIWKDGTPQLRWDCPLASLGDVASTSAQPCWATADKRASLFIGHFFDLFDFA